jgi:hypothetical protein
LHERIVEKFRVRDRFILGKLNELIGAKQHLRAEGSRHRASADVKQNEAVRLSPFIQMRNGYWDSAIPGKWSANQKLAGNGLRGSWLDWYPEVGQCLSTNLQWQSEVLDERRAMRKQSGGVFHTCGRSVHRV